MTSSSGLSELLAEDPFELDLRQHRMNKINVNVDLRHHPAADPSSSLDVHDQSIIKKYDAAQFGKRFKVQRPNIGSGGYGEISIIVDLATNKEHAAKRFKKVDSDEARAEMLREYHILEYLKESREKCSEYVNCPIELIEVVKTPTDRTYYAILEKCRPFTEVYYQTKHQPNFLEQAIKWMYQAVEGLEYIHTKGILHNDIKLENLLINDRNHIQYADFGLACHIPKGQQTCHIKGGTYTYQPPEYYLDQIRYPSSDVYSLGLTFYKIFTDEHYELPDDPFGHVRLWEMKWDANFGDLHRDHGLPIPIIKILKSMTIPDHTMRITPRGVLSELNKFRADPRSHPHPHLVPQVRPRPVQKERHTSITTKSRTRTSSKGHVGRRKQYIRF